MDALTNLFLSYEDGSNSSFTSSSSSSSSSFEPPFPSFFDLYLHERLISIVRPAYDHVLTILNDAYPELLSRVSIYREEFYSFFLFFIEFNHLQAYDALLVESFYGLKRWKIKYGKESKAGVASGKIMPLSQREKLISLALAILIPYLGNKLKIFLYNESQQNSSNENTEINNENIDGIRDERKSFLELNIHGKLHALRKGIEAQLRNISSLFSPSSFSENNHQNTHNARGRLRKNIIMLLKGIDSIYDLSYIFYRFLYITQLSPHYTPLLAMQNVVLKKLSATDYQQFQEAANYHRSSPSSALNSSSTNDDSSSPSRSISSSIPSNTNNEILSAEKSKLQRYIRLANYTRLMLLLVAIGVKYLEFLRNNETEDMDELVGGDGFNEDSGVILNNNTDNYISNISQGSLGTRSNNIIPSERGRRITINPNANRQIKTLLIPPPELPDLYSSRQKNDQEEPSVRLPRDSSLCPLCKKKRVNPCISRGGVCYCYRCIINYIREKKKLNPSAITRCPVTNEPLTENMVRRLYV